MDYKSILSQIEDFEHQCLLTSQAGKSLHKKIRNFIKDKYTQMWVHYHEKGFANQEEEIFFFKHVKPAVVSKIIFYSSVKEIEKGYDKVPEEHKNTYYQSIYDIILQENKALITQWKDFEYYKSGRNDLDSLYYTLNKGISIYSVTYSGSIELLKNNSTDFSTLLELNTTCHLLFKETLKHLRGKLLSIPKSQNQSHPNAIQ